MIKAVLIPLEVIVSTLKIVCKESLVTDDADSEPGVSTNSGILGGAELL